MYMYILLRLACFSRLSRRMPHLLLLQNYTPAHGDFWESPDVNTSEAPYPYPLP